MTKSTHTLSCSVDTALVLLLHTVHGTHTCVNEVRQSVVSTCMSVCVRRSDAKLVKCGAIHV